MSNYTKGTNFTAKDSLVTGNPSKLVKGSEIDAELNAVAAAIATKEDTTSVDTKLALKANLAGATYTGTHDFTGGTTTAATPASSDNSTKVATTAMVQQVAMNSALPSQTGNAGKFVKTDGTNASWDYAGISTVGATITDNYTIVGTTPTIWPVATTALGKSITAPAVTTSTPKGLFAVIDNKAGGYPVGWRDSTGTLIMAVAAGGVAQVYLEDNSTAAGVWRVNGSNLEPGLITIDSTFSSTYASTVLAPFVALDSNTSIHFATTTGGSQVAFVVDNTGKVVSTPVTFYAGTATICSAFKISATQAVVFWAQSTSYHAATVLTLTGSSPSYSLSVGTGANITPTMATEWGGENFSGAPKIAQLSSTLYLASYTSGTNTSVVAVSISGATVTIGTPANIITANTVANSTTTYALTATTALVLYKSGAAAPYANNAVVISVSGTTCTVGTPAALTGCASALTTAPSSVLLSSTKCLVGDDNNVFTSVIVATVTISGTTVTAGTALAVETVGTSNSPLASYVGNSATRYNPHLWAIGSNTAGCWYVDGNGISRAVVLSESGGTVTAGTIMYRSISTAASTATETGQIAPQGTTEFLAFKQEGVATSWRTRAVAHKIAGTTITTGATRPLVEIPHSARVALDLTFTRLSSGDYLVVSAQASGGLSSLPVLRTNGDAISYRGDIPVPVLVGLASTAAMPGVTSNRVVILGAATNQGSTIGASSATANQQLRLINVEIAA